MTGWVCIHTDGQAFRMELLKNVLDAEGIPVVVLNQRDSSYGFGELGLHVPESEVERAMMVLGLQAGRQDQAGSGE